MVGAQLVIISSIFLAALFSGARAAVLLLEPEELKQEAASGRSWARRAASLLDPPAGVLITARLAAELSFLVGVAAVLWLGPSGAWYSGLWLVVYMTVFLLLGELFPQDLARSRARKWAPALAWVLIVGRLVLWPWFRLAWAVDPAHRRPARGAERAQGSSAAREELAWRLRSREGAGQLLEEERRMIDRILRFSRATVREVMIPLIEVCAVEERAPVEEAIRTICEEGYSRLPVYRERVDRMLGIVRGMDLLEVENPEEPVSVHVRAVPFVPETMPVDELMVQLQRQGQHMAVVVDEYGGAVGIVTMEDLLEEIVGEIEDEYDMEEPQTRWISPYQVSVSARMEIEALNERLGLELPKEDYETLGGLLLKAFRRIPRQGDSLVLREVRFTVQRATDRSVEEVLITLPRLQGGTPGP